MEHMSHEEQHRQYPQGTVVFALNGERLGTVRTVHFHVVLVAQDGTATPTSKSRPTLSQPLPMEGFIYR